MPLEIRTPARTGKQSVLRIKNNSDIRTLDPDDKLPYALVTDVCQGDAVKPVGYGAILAQVRPDGQFQVIGYASR
jgi:hypothetical protein